MGADSIFGGATGMNAGLFGGGGVVNFFFLIVLILCTIPPLIINFLSYQPLIHEMFHGLTMVSVK